MKISFNKFYFVEFAEFLQHHTEAFVVEGDRVRLKNLPQPAEPIVVDESGQPLNGVKAKQFAVDYLKSLLEGVEAPMPMEIVYKNFCDKFQHSTRQEVQKIYIFELKFGIFFAPKLNLNFSFVGSEPKTQFEGF